MVVNVGAFPFDLPSWFYGVVWVPYWDPNTNTIKYIAGNTQGCDGENGTNPTVQSAQYLTLALLNKLNPDWKYATQGLPITIPSVTGEILIPISHVVGVQFNLISAPAAVDYWWGSSQFARFGICTVVTNFVYQLPVQYLNFQSGIIEFEDQAQDSVYLNLPKGVTANITLFVSPRNTSGNVNSVPPVFAQYYNGSSLVGYNWGAGGAPPTGLDPAPF